MYSDRRRLLSLSQKSTRKLVGFVVPSSLSMTSGSLKREESKTWNSKLEAGGGNG